MDVFNSHRVEPIVEANSPPVFKGIALFTPGGDCVYCIDPEKQAHWHIDLCAVLQQHLALLEPPYFLLPCFTATIDRWIDPDTNSVVTLAEAYPRVIRYQPLLNVLFQVQGVHWQPNYSNPETCSLAMIESFREQFPALWQTHDLVIQASSGTLNNALELPVNDPLAHTLIPQDPYIFRLFVRELDTAGAEKMLLLLRNTLESALNHPYTLQVIDVTQNPEQAELHHISATPTLVQVSPLPTRRLVGNLLEHQALQQLFGQFGT